MNPSNLKYSKEHEWAKEISDNRVQVGITHYAQDQLGDVVFIDLPPTGTQVKQFQQFGSIESVKAVSDLFSPVSGKVVTVNQALADTPELVNQDPYGQGWLIEVAISDTSELKTLLSSQDYEAYLKAQ